MGNRVVMWKGAVDEQQKLWSHWIESQKLIQDFKHGGLSGKCAGELIASKGKAS
jgi:hypothetical protein